MAWLMFVAGAVLSWGTYGVLLHQGQVRLGPLRALLCVGDCQRGHYVPGCAARGYYDSGLFGRH